MRQPFTSSQLLRAAFALSFVLPQGKATAQGPGLFEAFAARKDTPTDPVFGGMSVTGYSGIWGFRVGAALNFNGGGNNNTTNAQAGGQYYQCDRYQCRGYRSPPSYYYDPGIGIGLGGWSADADLMIAPLRTLPVMKSLLLGFSPYAFLGIGGDGVSPSNAPDTNRATWSYGAGVHHDLVGWLGLTAEARSRRSFGNSSPIAIGSSKNWEYRAGMSISFGGHSDDVANGASRGINVASDETKVNGFETAESAARITARVLDLAEGFVDTPYRSGSTNPSIGFDAAGFVQYVFAQEGIALPRTSHAIAELGEEISTRVGSLRPGDLLFFGNDGSSIDHVAIYAGHDRIIHATASGGGVRYDVLGEGPRGEWFVDHLVTARRLVSEGHAVPHVRRDESRDEGELDEPDNAPRAGRTPGE
jgi:cell wall-associated NlpC family hydrolase